MTVLILLLISFTVSGEIADEVPEKGMARYWQAILGDICQLPGFPRAAGDPTKYLECVRQDLISDRDDIGVWKLRECNEGFLFVAAAKKCKSIKSVQRQETMCKTNSNKYDFCPKDSDSEFHIEKSELTPTKCPCPDNSNDCICPKPEMLAPVKVIRKTRTSNMIQPTPQYRQLSPTTSCVCKTTPCICKTEMIIDIIDGLTAPPFAYQPPRHEPTQRTSFPSFPYQITPKPFENLNFYQTNAYRPYLNPFSASPSPNSPDYQYFRPTVATPLKPPPPQNPQKEEQNGLNTQQFVTNNYKNINNIKFVPNPSNFNNNKPLTFPQRDPVTPAPQTRANNCQITTTRQQYCPRNDQPVVQPQPCALVDGSADNAKYQGICSWMLDPLAADPDSRCHFLQCQPAPNNLFCGRWQKMPCAPATVFDESAQVCVWDAFSVPGTLPPPMSTTTPAPVFRNPSQTQTLTFSIPLSNLKSQQCSCKGGVQIGSCNNNYQCPGQSVCQIGNSNNNKPCTVCCYYKTM